MPRPWMLPAALLICAAGPATGGEGALPGDALAAGETHIALRYRYEHVDQDSIEEEAGASTARLRLNHRTSAWRGWRAFGELDYVGEVLTNDYNSGGGSSPDRTHYPLVADPGGGDLNQLYAEYEGGADWRLRLGRQRILLDDQRFVGGVGWRQNEQTFDAISVLRTTSADSGIFYAWIANTNRIFGDTVAAGDHRMSTHILNARLPVTRYLQATPYAYYIDNEDDPSASTATHGIRLEGSHEGTKGSLDWLADVAIQSDAANAPVDFVARYWQLELRWKPAGRSHSAGVGITTLSGHRSCSGAAFRTPLATLHAFQGWADQFTVTPDAGIVDLYASLALQRGDWRFETVYHDFSPEAGNGRLGRELDLLASRSLGERYALTFKAAFFDAGSAEPGDVKKAWLMVTAAY